ncbi:MAG: adenylosuccinate synthetase [Clostridia bacterium]
MNNYVVTGMSFGDECKGSMIDYLATKHGIKTIIRHNGGSQASHTVILPNGKFHKFSQIGSGSFNKGTKTILSENMVVNPLNLVREAEAFSEVIGLTVEQILTNVFISENCLIATPFHKCLNRLKEISLGKNARGSFGTGVSEVTAVLSEYGASLKVKDLLDEKTLIDKLKNLQEIMIGFYELKKIIITENLNHLNASVVEKEYEFLKQNVNILSLANLYMDYIKNYKPNIFSDIESLVSRTEPIIFESSQGILIDKNLGIKPNTTLLDTTNQNAIKLSSQISDNPLVKIGAIKTIDSNHGFMAFPTEDEELNLVMSDPNQVDGLYVGKPRYGYFDMVLLDYSLSHNSTDYIALTWCDQLSKLKTNKICYMYDFSGEVSEEMKQNLEIEKLGSKTYITKIKNNFDGLKNVLLNCKPVYEEIAPKENFLSKKIESLSSKKVLIKSFGPTRNDKIDLSKEG